MEAVNEGANGTLLPLDYLLSLVRVEGRQSQLIKMVMLSMKMISMSYQIRFYQHLKIILNYQKKAFFSPRVFKKIQKLKNI